MRYYHRDLEALLTKAVKQFPVILITGPRQAGKSTLLQQCFREYPYVTMDDPSLRALASEDPELFLSTHPAPLIIDEIQYVPSLLPYLKIRVDRAREEYGQYILTGSQTFQLMEGVSETLAGRIAVFHLYPFNWNEIQKIPDHSSTQKDDLKTMTQIIQGFYPEFFKTPDLDVGLWFSSYISTYLERDVRNIKAISDLGRFQTFLSLLTTRVGSLLNLSEIAKECGISQPTAKDWVSILESTYVIHLLRPYFRNHSKRLIKSPKLYFVDTGLLCYLLGIDSSERLLKASERGSIFENMVIMDWVKKTAYASQNTNLYFYRTLSGLEVDLIVEQGLKLSAYEIKFSKSISSKMGSSLKSFQESFPKSEGKILCLRETPLPISRGIEAIHWSEA